MKTASVCLLLFMIASATASLSHGQSLRELKPSRKLWKSNRDFNRTAPRVYISRVSANRRLAWVGDTIYMLNSHNRIVWRWSTNGPPLTDHPIVDSRGVVYAIALDLIRAAIDSKDGRERWRGTANGKAVYSQIKGFTDDRYMVVIDMQGYRDSFRDNGVNDWLEVCRGNSIVWRTEIPPEARIEIRDNRIYAVGLIGRRRKRTRISIPERLSKPIGRVSESADFE